MRERAEASLGRERMRLQTWFQDLLTQAADAKDEAGSLARMLCNASSFISVNSVRCVLILTSLLVLDEDDADASRIVVNFTKKKTLFPRKCNKETSLLHWFYKVVPLLYANNIIPPRVYWNLHRTWLWLSLRKSKK